MSSQITTTSSSVKKRPAKKNTDNRQNKRKKVTYEDMSTWKLIEESVKFYDLYRLKEFVQEDSQRKEILHVDTPNQGKRTFIYEYIDCAGSNMHPEVIRRIVRTPGF